MSAPATLPESQPALDRALAELRACADDDALRLAVRAALDQVPPDDLFVALKDASEAARTVDIAESLRLADALILGAEEAGAPGHRAMGLMARGDALRARGEFAAATAALDDAGATFLALGDEVGWARTRIGWLLSENALGRGREALAVVDRARAALVGAAMWLRAGILELNAGTVLRYLGRYEEALTGYERARHAFRKLGDGDETLFAMVDVNIANVLPYLGEFQSALQLQEEVRQRWHEKGDQVRVAWQDHNIADALAGLGYYTRALQRYGAAAAMLEKVGLNFEAALNQLYAAGCYLHLNLFARAREEAETALITFERLNTPAEAGRARLVAAQSHLREGDYAGGAGLLDAATADFRASELAEELALALLERSGLQLHSGNWPAALLVATEARDYCAAHGLVVHRAQAELLRGRAALAMGDEATATEAAVRGLVVAAQHEITWLRPEAHALRGDIARGRGDAVGALAAYEEAITDVEVLQRYQAIDLRTNFLADKRALYDAAIKLSLILNEPHNAFAYLERARSRALYDYLASDLDARVRGHAGDPTLLARLSGLRAEHHWLSRRRYDVAAGDGAVLATAAEEVELRAKIAALEGHIGRLTDHLALARTEGLPVALGRGADEHQPPDDLEPGTIMVEYHLRTDGATAFVVTGGELRAVPLALTASEAARLLKGWQLHLSLAARALMAGAPLNPLAGRARAALHALYRALIAPLEEYLDGCARLVVVPDGALQAVPFGALFDGERHLTARFEVAGAPSSGLLRHCRAQAHAARRGAADLRALVLAYSDDGRLPYIDAEARAVADLLPGELHVGAVATLETLRSVAPRYPLLHIAAHGEARLDNPTFSHLALADGQLGPSDVVALDLGGAIVVLSGCETGRGQVTAGDELIGLSRGFLYAGAATLVQSLWRVEDRATADLMVHFYRGLAAGLGAGAALRAAQLCLLSAGQAHPYLWGPFQLLGDSGPLATKAVC